MVILSNLCHSLIFFLTIFSLFCFNYTHGQASAPAPSTLSPRTVLKVFVPVKVGFQSFVSWTADSTRGFNITGGFSIEVFEQVFVQLRLKNGVDLSYEYIPIGDGITTPQYDSIIRMVSQSPTGSEDVEYAAVGDFTITYDRMDEVTFTQPYTPSALVVVVPVRYAKFGRYLWDFLRPFSLQLWLSILIAYFGTAFVIWIIESDNPVFHDPGPDNQVISWHQRVTNIFWFTSLTIFFCLRGEGIQSNLGRLVTIVWLIVVLIFSNSYTANLSSSLTAQRLSPIIQGFDSLRDTNVPVGYQNGSFTKKFLMEQKSIPEWRLKSLATANDFTQALRLGPNKPGGVAAIVDELPYVDNFLATNCDFIKVGPQVSYFGGLGFAFQKNSTYADQMSKAILYLAQNGVLQDLHDKLVGQPNCSDQTVADHLRLRSFGGLFIILAVVYICCVLWHLAGKKLWSSQASTTTTGVTAGDQRTGSSISSENGRIGSGLIQTSGRSSLRIRSGRSSTRPTSPTEIETQPMRQLQEEV